MSNDVNLKGSPSVKTGNVQSKAPKGATGAKGATEAPQGATEAPQGATGATGATEAPQGATGATGATTEPTTTPPEASTAKVDPFDAKVVACDDALKALRAENADERAIGLATEALTIAIAERSVARAEDAVRNADEAFKSAVASGDDDKILSAAAERKSARSKLDAVKVSAGIEAFVPSMRVALASLVIPGNVPTGRFTLSIIFEDGKPIDVRRTAIEGSVPSPVKSGPVPTPSVVKPSAPVRANLGVVDPRIPPAGWTTTTEIQSGGKGIPGSWEITMLADASCRATSKSGQTIEGRNLASVLRTLTGQPSVDQYARFHLGSPGTVFDPKSPAKGWTFKG